MYRLGAFAPFHWVTRHQVLILMYHRFSGEKEPYKISANEFAAHLEYLSRHHRVLPLSETVEALRKGKTLPANTVVMTIDDGYADAYEIAFPLLKKYRMPATVYAVTDFLDGKCWMWTDLMRFILQRTEKNKIEIEFENDKIECAPENSLQRIKFAERVNARLKKIPDELKEKKISEIAAALSVVIPEKPTEQFAPVGWEEAREMEAENVRIESHTVRHPILTNVSAEKLGLEVKQSKKRLEEKLNKRIEHFCYPNGNLNKNVQKAVEDAGYQSATTTCYGFNAKETNRFLLNRMDAPPDIANFAQSVSGFEAFRRRF